MKQSTMCEILTPIQTTSLEMMGNHANVIICLSNGSFSIVVNPMVHCVMWGWVIGDYSASCYDHRCYLCKLSREFFFLRPSELAWNKVEWISNHPNFNNLPSYLYISLLA